ncbi:MAG TPA: EFR1 family ferrodoxin [Bacillota bacterium]|nr:EFR1 family ferrodoxin [Bacillota bacterium]
MPNATLLYFTGTGNTLALAQAAKQTLESAEWQVRLVNVAGSYEPLQNDLVGLFFPVYSFGPPRIITRFLRRLPDGNGTPAFVVANPAESAGGAAGMAHRALSAKGYSVRQSYTVLMPSNYILGGGSVDDERAASIIATATAKVQEMTTSLLRDGSTEAKPPRVAIASAFANWAFVNGLPFMGRMYRYSEKCTGCGACVEMCPMGVISLNDAERPVWSRGCEHCMRCVNHCPFDAIEVGRLTRGKRRYKYWTSQR